MNFCRVQCLPFDPLLMFHDTVFRVANKRMSDGGHVHTDLMCPPCFQPAGYDGMPAQSFDYLKMSNCCFAMLSNDSHFFSVLGMPADGCFDSSRIRRHRSLHNSQIDPAGGVIADLIGQ